MTVAGKYQYGNDIEKGRLGLAYVYAKNDSAILIYLDLNRGAPSYNMGSVWGEVVIKNGKGLFNISIEGYKKSCQFFLEFKGAKLTIKTINDQDDCGFGYGVIADGTFKKISAKNPAYFTDATGEKVYFKNLD